MSRRNHWDSIYRGKDPDRVSWYRPHLDRSLAFIEKTSLPRTAAILDVGGGSSTLVDDLLDRGYDDVTVLDLSERALAQAKARLGARAKTVAWVVGDVTEMALPKRRFDLWHDRAVFHFLTEPAARERYVDAVRRALKPNGYIIVATFGPEGPERCSGLPIARYSADGLHREFGERFAKVGSETEIHQTPWGAEQEFVYCYCRMPG